ncbi:MAG: methionine synthase [Chitinophagaceae bacterium]|nr:methionine synthase [Chitinophagaceae bacterium]
MQYKRWLYPDQQYLFLQDGYLLKLGDTKFNIQKIIYGQLKKAETVALFVCTAGADIGEYAESLIRRGDVLEGYIMDKAGSEIVEAAMDKMQHEMEKRLNSLNSLQLHITNRYSPGYCGWNVAEQQKLFSFFPADFCGVTLTEQSLMQPVKSVSGIIGIGRHVKRNAYKCNICEEEYCIYRNRQT